MAQQTIKVTNNATFYAGATFTPSVDAEGNLSWTNDRNLPNPPTINIRGPMGEVSEEQLEVVQDQIDQAKVGYYGKQYENLEQRLDGDYNLLLDKFETANYKDTTIHATNTYARNLTQAGGKVEILGQTIQNCLDHHNGFDYNAQYSFIYTHDKIPDIFPTLKTNTKYTLFVYNISFVNKLSFAKITDNNAANPNSDESKFSNDFKTIITTNIQYPTTENVIYIRLNSVLTLEEEAELSNMKVMILEGDWTNKEVSFVPFGLNYPNTIEVKLCNKNMLISTLETSTINGVVCTNNGDGSYTFNGTASGITYFDLTTKLDTTMLSGAKIFCDETYNCGGDSSILLRINRGSLGRGAIQDINANNVVINDNGEELTLSIRIADGYTCDNVKFTPMIYFGDDANFIKNTNNIVLINQPLASISDTICDRVYVKDGKIFHEQTVKEIVFDGSEDWELNFSGVRYYIKIQELKNVLGSKILCNYFNEGIWTNNEINTISLGNSGVATYDGGIVGISALNFESAEELKSWLQRKNSEGNPCKIIAELATPIVTELGDVDDFYSYDDQTNWYTTNVVKPTLDVDIPSNLTALVSNLMVENTSLKQENQSLSNDLQQTNENLTQQQANMDYLSMMTGVDL